MIQICDLPREIRPGNLFGGWNDGGGGGGGKPDYSRVEHPDDDPYFKDPIPGPPTMNVLWMATGESSWEF
jgi:hypothetical protein